MLNWFQVNSNFWVYTCLTLFHLFWSLPRCFTHFAYVLHTGHITCISCCTPYAQHRHTHAQWFTSWILLLFTWLNTYSMLFCVCLLCFRLFYLCFELTWIYSSFVFYVCVFALPSFLFLSSPMQMSLFKSSTVKGGCNKGKEPVIDVDEPSPKSKITCFSTGVYNLDLFRSYAAFQTYRS